MEEEYSQRSSLVQEDEEDADQVLQIEEYLHQTDQGLRSTELTHRTLSDCETLAFKQ